MLLKDKVILVTGGSTGIGRDCAVAYAKEGAKVVVVARDGELSEKVAAEIGSHHMGRRCDVSKAGDVQATVDAVLARYGRLDVIHNNAGIATPSKPLHETTEEEWNALLAINLTSVFHTTRYGFEAIRKARGSILMTSSMVGVMGQEIHAAYTATKGAMNTLAKSMALDYAPLGIRVNAVCPAGTWTPMLRRWVSEQPDAAAINDYLDLIHPLGYCPEGDVIADACVFMLSDKARFITGHILHVSGGAELGYRRTSAPASV